MRVCYVAEVGYSIADSQQSLINLVDKMKEREIDPYVVSHKNWELIEYFKKIGVLTKVVKSRISTYTRRKKYVYIVFRMLSPMIHIYNRIMTIQAELFLKKYRTACRHYLICNG